MIFLIVLWYGDLVPVLFMLLGSIQVCFLFNSWVIEVHLRGPACWTVTCLVRQFGGLPRASRSTSSKWICSYFKVLMIVYRLAMLHYSATQSAAPCWLIRVEEFLYKRRKLASWEALLPILHGTSGWRLVMIRRGQLSKTSRSFRRSRIKKRVSGKAAV